MTAGSENITAHAPRCSLFHRQRLVSKEKCEGSKTLLFMYKNGAWKKRERFRKDLKFDEKDLR